MLNIEDALTREEKKSERLFDKNCLNRQLCCLDQFSLLFENIFATPNLAFSCKMTWVSMAEMINVGGINSFPSAGQSQHFYSLKTDVVCVNTVASL